MNTDLRKKTKNYFIKDSFKLIEEGSFQKNYRRLRKQRDMKLLTTEARRD